MGVKQWSPKTKSLLVLIPLLLVWFGISLNESFGSVNRTVEGYLLTWSVIAATLILVRWAVSSAFGENVIATISRRAPESRWQSLRFLLKIGTALIVAAFLWVVIYVSLGDKIPIATEVGVAIFFVLLALGGGCYARIIRIWLLRVGKR